jgi:RNA polymerase sigma factor FliA
MGHDIEQYYPKVQRLAWKWYRKMGGKEKSSWDIGDLIHEGLKGLCEAESKYEPHLGTKFWSYARFRVNGAIVDFLRRSSSVPIPQKKWNQTKICNEAIYKLTNDLLRKPTEEELAKELDISIDDLQGLQNPLLESVEFNDTEIYGDKNVESPLTKDMRFELFHDVEECRSRLSDKEKLILEARNKGVTLMSLAKSFKTSHESIRRWHNTGLQKMKRCLESKEWTIEDVVSLEVQY